jgi:DNA-binding transcriptional regulator PaaX
VTVVGAAAADDAGTGSPARRPQQLMLSFLGGLVLDRDVEPIGSGVFLRLLGDLGVTEAAARATLARLTRTGVLRRRQQGRTARYALTEAGAATMRRAGERVDSRTPFGHAGQGWTMLSYSIPETHRALRQQIRARLAWAGFGGLRDGVWIAPGRVDLRALFADGDGMLGEIGDLADGFHAMPADGTDMTRLVRRAWDLAAIRAEHDRFQRLWGQGPALDGGALPSLTLLLADWLHLLRADPGLPAEHLPRDWPASRSARICRGHREVLGPLAARELRALLAADAERR